MNPKKPDDLKKKLGTYRKDRKTDLTIISFDQGELTIPKDIEEVARVKEIFISLATYLIEAGNYKAVDNFRIGPTAKAIYQYEIVSSVITVDPREALYISDSGYTQSSATYSQFIKLTELCDKMLTSLGIGAAGRKALDITVSKTKKATKGKVALR